MPTVTVPIPLSGNDQFLTRAGATYDTGTITRDTTAVQTLAYKTNAGGTHTLYTALLLFNTGDYLPDGATVTSATLTAYQDGFNNQSSRWVVGDYFTYAGTTADWNPTPAGNALAIQLATLGSADGWRTISLTNVGNISTTGTTSLNIGINGGAAPSGNFNQWRIRTFDWGGFTPYLTINYTTNIAPTASFSVSGTGMSRTFTDTSTDPDGTIAYSWWRVGDGTADYQSLVPFAHTYANGGTYTVSHWVYDNSGALSNTATQSVVIAAPHVDFTYTTSPGTAHFTDTTTPASGTTIVSRSWNFGEPSSGSNTSSLQNPSHTYSAGGTYTVTLTETDSAGASVTISKPVTVSPPAPNQPPTAYFTASTGALTVDFADASSDPDNAIVSWAWDFGDAGTSTSQNPSHTYSATGTYTVSLTVTDAIGATNTYSRSMTVRTAGSANSYVAGPIFLRESTLTANVDATQTTIPVAELGYWPPNGALWPSKNEGMLDPEGAAEKITWTGKSAAHGPGNLTGVTRGAFGTTAASHSSGEIIGLYGRHDAGLKIKGKIPIFPVNASLTLAELRRHFDSERFVWADFNNLNEQAQLEITGAPTSTGNVSITLDEGGTAVTRNPGVTSAKEVRSLVIGAAQTAVGTITLTLNSAVTSIPLLGNLIQKHQYVIGGTATAGGGPWNGDVVYYNASNTQVLAMDSIASTVGDSAATTAGKLRAGSWSGWTMSGSGATAIATATTTGHRGASPYTSTYQGFFYGPDNGQTATHTLLQQGSSLLTAAQVADLIRQMTFQGWVTGGTGTTVTFTALEPGAMTGTFSYNNGGTGATGTLNQTTAGTQSTPAQVATAIRAQYSGNTYWTVGGSGATVTWDALTSGAKQDATFTSGTTGTVGNMQTIHQGSTDIVGYLSDSGGIEQTRRLLGNLATTTEFNLETSVSGSGTTKGIISFWGSFGTDPLTLLWRVENLDLTEFPVGEAAYGVTSESSSGLTWDVRSDEVEITNRGKTYYRDHNLQGNLLGQLYYYGLLEPEQAREDIFVQELWQPVTPGLEISLAFWMRYKNLPASFPCKPLFITFHHIDGTITEVGDASGLTGLSGDADWDEYELTFTAPTLEANPVPAYWMHIRSRNMSQGTIFIQEIVPSLGPVAKRTPYYAFEGSFKAQLDMRTPKPVFYLPAGKKRLELETQYDLNGGTVSSQYRSADDPILFDGTWYTDSILVPDLPVIDAENTLTGDGLSTPEVLSGFPRAEYRNTVGQEPIHVLLKSDRTEFEGTVLIDNVQEWFPRPGIDPRILPSGRVRRQKFHEPVGYMPPFDLIAVRPEAVKYISERWGTEEFYAEISNELLKLKFLTEPVFEKQSPRTKDTDGRRSYYRSNKVGAEVVEVSELAE